MSLKTGSRWSNWAWDKPVKAFIWRSSRICRPIGGLPPWFFEDSLPHLLLRNNSNVEAIPGIAQGRFRPSNDLGIDVPHRGAVRGPDEDVGVGISQQLAHERGRERLLGRWL